MTLVSRLHIVLCSRLTGAVRVILHTFSCRSAELTGDRVRTVVKVLCTNREFAGSIPVGVIGIFRDIKCFRSQYGRGFDSASTEMSTSISWGVKAAGA